MNEIRALIVDDSSDKRKIVARVLRQAGLGLLEVYEAGTGIEGLNVLRTMPVDLILIDIGLPAMDGLELLRQIRAQHLALGVPVVMITSEGSGEQVKRAILAGARGFIREPFVEGQVKEQVLRLVRAA
jgi:two-component system, chemotaxis family, chemotaxis protein CheY